MTIVNYDCSFDDYRHEALDRDAVDLLVGAYRRCPKAIRHHSVPLKLFECVAQLLRVRVSGKPLSVDTFWRVSLAFVGAINSKKFIDASYQWRHRHTTAFRLALNFLREDGLFVPPLTYKSQIAAVDTSLVSFVDYFENLKLDEEAIWLWRGWWTANAEGRTHFLPLYPIYDRFGRPFTQELYEALDTYFARGRARHLGMVRPIAEFIGGYPGPLDPRSFRDGQFMTQFWVDCFKYYATSAHKKGNQIPTILTAWNSSGRCLVEQCFEASGLFAKPTGGMPAVPAKNKPGSATNIKKTGTGLHVKTRLLTEVPLHVTDEVAIKLLFGEIQREVDLIEQWAQARVDELTRAALSRGELAKAGTVRVVQDVGANTAGHKDLVSKGNSKALANAAATFERYGFQTHLDARIALMYPQPLPETALQLGIPVSGAVVPHLALLVLDHPKITASFLEKLQLYDKSGRQSGFTLTDGSAYLCGRKDRSSAWQEIPLTTRGIQVVESLIAMTQPLRDYLRMQGDDDWRYLLLSSGKSFGRPLKANNLSGWTTDPGQQQKRSLEVERVTALPLAQAQDLMRRFSLATCSPIDGPTA